MFSETLILITRELDRQVRLKALGKFKHTCADAELSPADKLVILTEEVGEVARAIQGSDRQNLIEELTQVAAVAIAWLESLE